MDIINTNLSINTERISNTKYKVTIQSFPQKNEDILNYKLVFDMKFREDYESDFDGVCIGPTWNENKPGEIKITLKKDNNFKTNINGKFYQNSIEDDCKKYIYYLRYFESTADSGEIIKYGVATDYAENYPDAPNYWSVNKNNEIEKIGTTNIKKYSIKLEGMRNYVNNLENSFLNEKKDSIIKKLPYLEIDGHLSRYGNELVVKKLLEKIKLNW